jgi:hypothetical protein
MDMSPIQIEFDCLAVDQYQRFLFLGFAKWLFWGRSAAATGAKVATAPDQDFRKKSQ